MNTAIPQVPCGFELGPDTLLCPGGQIGLSAPPGLGTYQWNTGATTPGISVNTPGTYACTVTQQGVGGQELLTNGDFSGGIVGFTSAYVAPTVEGPYGLLSDESQYAVTTDPSLAHVDFSSCGDHTSGTGNMMVVNGAATPNVDIWCQQVDVEPGTDYSFSAWLMTAFPANPATLGFSINGVLIGSPLAAPATPCIWEEFSASWNAGTATQATVCIVNLNTEIFGNDFALDDISFIGGSSAPCTFTDSIQVSLVSTALDLGPDRDLCPGASILLDAGVATDGVLWSTGEVDAQLEVESPGLYWVIGTQEGCPVADTVLVSATTEASPTDTGPFELCPGDQMTLLAPAGALAYAWSTGAMTPGASIDAPGTYTVTLTMACGPRTDTVHVLPGECITTLYVPNAFTPNADGINDLFHAVVRGPFEPFVLQVFDRWGELLFEALAPEDGWDASYKGTPVQDGVYVWRLRYQHRENTAHERRDLHGHVTVIR